MADGQLPVYLLLVANLGLYSLLGAQMIRIQWTRPKRSLSLPDAFRLLEEALTEAFPDLPPGFTWREALARVRASKIGGDLGIEKALAAYEAYRYGGIRLQDTTSAEVVMLSDKLSGGSRIAWRN